MNPSELAEVILNAEPRPGERATETSTVAIPARHLDQAQAETPAPSPAAWLRTEALPARSQTRPARGRLGLWLGIVACLALAGAAATLFLRPKAPERANAETAVQAPARSTPEPVPPELRPYMDQAARGDAKAMHMIALMYWNGLNVKQDRVKGLAWYRRSAAAGDKGAQKELRVIEGK